MTQQYMVEYHDPTGFQDKELVEAGSREEAGQKSVAQDTRVGPAVADQFELKVYPHGEPQDHDFFDYTDF